MGQGYASESAPVYRQGCRSVCSCLSCTPIYPLRDYLPFWFGPTLGERDVWVPPWLIITVCCLFLQYI